MKHEHFACSTLLLLLNVFVIEKSCPRGSLIRVPLTRSFCVCVTLLTNNQQIRVLICAQTTWSLTENFPAWDSAMNEWIKTARNVVSTDYAEPSGRSRLYSSRPAALTMAFFSLLKSPFPLLPFFLTPPAMNKTQLLWLAISKTSPPVEGMEANQDCTSSWYKKSLLGCEMTKCSR